MQLVSSAVISCLVLLLLLLHIHKVFVLSLDLRKHLPEQVVHCIVTCTKGKQIARSIDKIRQEMVNEMGRGTIDIDLFNER